MNETEKITFIVKSKSDDIGADRINNMIENVMEHNAFNILSTEEKTDFSNASWFVGYSVGVLTTLKDLECIKNDCCDTMISAIMNKIKNERKKAIEIMKKKGLKCDI